MGEEPGADFVWPGRSPIELAFTPDGKTFACSLGGTVARHFETASGHEIDASNVGHSNPVAELQFSSNGSTLLTAVRKDSARAWDLTTGRELRQVPLPKDANHVAVSASGRYFAAGTDSEIVAWDSADGYKIGAFKADGPDLAAIAISPDGTIIASASRGARQVSLWDRATGRQLRFLTAAPADEPDANAREAVRTPVGGVLTQKLLFSPDGRYLAGAGAKRQLCLWDAASGNTIWEKELPATQVVEDFAFGPAGLALATINWDRTIGVYETASGDLRCRLGRPDTIRPVPMAIKIGNNAPTLRIPRQPTSSPVSIAVSPCGRFIAAASSDPLIHIWDLATAQEVGQFPGHQGGVVALAFQRRWRTAGLGEFGYDRAACGTSVPTRTQQHRMRLAFQRPTWRPCGPIWRTKTLPGLSLPNRL